MVQKVELDGFNRITKAKYGYLIYNKNDLFVGRAVEQYGEYAEHEVSLYRSLCRPGDIVMDIGANIGTLTLALSGIVGKDGFVYAFDPQHIVFQTLCANMAINSIVNVECLPYAVSDENGYVRVPRFDYNLEGNYGGLCLDDFPYGNRVCQIKIDDYFYDLDRLDFIKIDVEGMESKVIRGGEKTIQRFRPIMYVENDKLEKSKYLIGYIKSLKYRMYWHTPFLFNKDNFKGNKRNIYPNIASVNMICIPEESDVYIKASEITDVNYNPIR